MRGAFMIVIVITLLIVCFLVMKDMNSKPVDGIEKKEMIQRAEKAVERSNAAVQRIRDARRAIDSK